MKKLLAVLAAVMAFSLTSCQTVSETIVMNDTSQVSGSTAETSDSGAASSSSLTAKSTAATSAKITAGSKTTNKTTKAAETTKTTTVIGAVVYKNTQYGFQFSLPADWKGYTVLTDKWQGTALDNLQISKDQLTGPEITLRNPHWTEQNKYQDIPIMVYTLAQWNSLQNNEYAVGAAPINPSELGRNVNYVFALPARYDFTCGIGLEEVHAIIDSKPLQPIAAQ